MHEYPQALSFDMYFTEYALIAVIALAAFTALLVGADYSDGTIRNKLVAGSRRSCVYLSSLAVQIVAGLGAVYRKASVRKNGRQPDRRPHKRRSHYPPFV